MQDSKDRIRVGVVMPVVLQNEAMLEMTLETLRHIRFGRPKEGAVSWSFHLLCNRLTVRSVAQLVGEADHAGGAQRAGLLQQHLSDHESVPPALLEAVNDRERTVAGAWNEGARRAILRGAEFVLILANDARLRPGCLEALLDFGRDAENEKVAVWTACQAMDARGVGAADGADFSCFMIRPRTLAAHGFFDENFRPAYFEDNDYYARVVLSGEGCRILHAARYDHLGSQTLHQDAEMAHHIRYWFPRNEDYFVRKWGRKPADTEAEVRATYNRTPFNGPRPLCWWELEPDRK